MGARRVALPADYRERRGEGALATTLLRGYGWEEARFSVRCTHIHGPNVEILNVMGFPASPAHQPILATDFICYGGRPRIAVADLQPLWGRDSAGVATGLTAKLDDMLRPLAESFADVRAVEELPDWCAEYFTPYCFFALPNVAAAIPRLIEAYHAYCDAWSDGWIGDSSKGEPRSDLGDVAAAGRLVEYKRHHRESSPGLSFMAKVFGAEWSESYLREFMYR
jgi:hypothetical protein